LFFAIFALVSDNDRKNTSMLNLGCLYSILYSDQWGKFGANSPRNVCSAPLNGAPLILMRPFWCLSK